MNDAERTAPERERRRWLHLSQETLAIVGSAIALATLMLATTGDIRDEARADREHFQREILRLTGETARLSARADPE